MLGSLVFVVSALLELAFVVLVSRAPNHVDKKLHDGNRGTTVISNSGGLSRIQVDSNENSAVKAEEERVHGNNCMKIISNMPPIHIVDLISFGLYLFFFILCNGIYWISY